jgi:hypothetical protein
MLCCEFFFGPRRFGEALTKGSLWSLKLCILDFYSRFVDVLRWGKLATNILWWFIVITFLAVIVATLTECRPLSL